MKKILLNITERQKEALDEKSKQYGISLSEFVRRILDMFLCQPHQKATYTIEEKDTVVNVNGATIDIKNKKDNLS